MDDKELKKKLTDVFGPVMQDAMKEAKSKNPKPTAEEYFEAMKAAAKKRFAPK